ncbi:MAG: patatin-like phospholipase family protein, partial [Gemmatimonadales bacterium]
MSFWPAGPRLHRHADGVRTAWLSLLTSALLTLPGAQAQATPTQQAELPPALRQTPARQQDSASVAESPGRKLGLVLSGGSARGFAHIGVIRVLDRAGLEFDVVTGTSMGSIIGALHATGYSPGLMLHVAASADWDELFDDNALRQNLPLERKAEVDRLVFTVPIRRGRPTLPGGFIAGQRIGQFFALLTWQAHPVRDFRALPIDFAAVATDAETGEAVRLQEGYLPEALRASSAIPSVFAPVEIDGRLLTDGGVSRNLPAEDARALGADFLVCSDVSKPLMPADSLNNLLAVLDQTIGYRGWESTLRQRQLCDVLILPDITGLSSTAFDKAEAWAARGDSAARAALAELVARGLLDASALSLPKDDVA